MRRMLRSTLFPYTTLFRSGNVGCSRIAREHEGPAREIGARDQIVIDPGTDMLCLCLHFLHQPGPLNRAAKAGIVLNLGRRSEEHTSELQSLRHLVCRLLLE